MPADCALQLCTRMTTQHERMWSSAVFRRRDRLHLPLEWKCNSGRLLHDILSRPHLPPELEWPDELKPQKLSCSKERPGRKPPGDSQCALLLMVFDSLA